MKLLHYYIAAVLIVAPTLASAQETAARIGQKQKAWLVSNFRTGLTCSASPGGAVSFSGQLSFDDSDNDGIEIAVSSDGGATPVITAHAINIKGTGANSQRTVVQACPVGGASRDGAASCSLWGDPHEADFSITVPLSALADGPSAAKNYVGHVTLIKQRTSAAISAWLSKKGYDYYRAQNDRSAAGATIDPAMTPLATCDSSKLTTKGEKPIIATYDLVLLKK